MGIGSTAALLPGTCNNRHLFARHHLACATSCDGLLEDAAKNVMPREEGSLRKAESRSESKADEAMHDSLAYGV